MNIKFFIVCFFFLFTADAAANRSVLSSAVEMERSIIESAVRDVNRINAALLHYYQINRAWPAALSDLNAAGLYSGDFRGPSGGFFAGESFDSGRYYRLSFAAPAPNVAQAVANMLPNGQTQVSTVITFIGTPQSSDAYRDMMSRQVDPDGPERNRFETDLDMGGNSLRGVNAGDAQRANAQELRSRQTEINRVRTGRVTVGSTIVEADPANGMQISNGNVVVTNDVQVGGNVTAQSLRAGRAVVGQNLQIGGNVTSDNGNLSGFTNAAGGRAIVRAGQAEIGNARITNSASFDAETATIDNLTAQTATGDSLIGQDLTVNSGHIQNIETDTAEFDELTTTTLTSDSLSGTNLQSTNAYGRQTVTSNLTGQNARINNLTASNANINAVSGGRAEAQNYTGGNVNTTTVVASGNSSITNVTTNNAQITTLTVNELSAQNASISNNVTVGSNVTAGRAVVTGVVNAGSLNASTGTITNVTGSTMDFDTIQARDFNGGNFTGDDFVTSQSSVNTNHGLITNQQQSLDTCMYVTEFCFPKAPVISDFTCAGCSQSGFNLNYSATISARVSECVHGCTYSWSVTGGASGSCSSGTVSPGYTTSMNVQCDISVSHTAGESTSGEVRINAHNTRRPEFSSTRSVNYSFQSNAAPLPTVSVSCSNCSQEIESSTSESFTANLTASVSNCPYGCSISWSDLCSGSSNSCAVSRTVASGSEFNGTATITARSNADSSMSSSASHGVSFTVTTPAAPPPVLGAPTVAISCLNCTQSVTDTTAQTFTANLTTSVTNCDTGCSFTWSGACSGSASSCSVTQSVASGSTFNGTAFVLVTRDSDSVTSSNVSQSVSFTVTNDAEALLNVNCDGCSQIKTSNNIETFNAIITATYNNCSNCNLSFNLPSGVSAVSGCGSIIVNGDGQQACSVRSTLMPGQTIEATANISIPGQLRSQMINFRIDSTPPPPTVDWMAGCYVDTSAYDYINNSTSCGSNESRNAAAAIVWSVGDTSVGDRYTAPSGYTFSWSGDCVGSGNTCGIQGSCTTSFSGTTCPALGDKVANVVVLDSSGNVVFTSSIMAVDATFYVYDDGGGLID